MSILPALLAVVLLALTLPGTLTLALLTFAGSLPRQRRDTAASLPGRFALVVPAHNENAGLRRTLDNLLELARADGATDVVVIADNCSDDTAAIARAAGALAIERSDPVHRGKGHALDYAFGSLAASGYAAYAVIDADTLAAGNLLASLRRHFGSGAAAVQTRYTVLNGAEAPRTQLAEVALAAFNVLRPRGRDRLGLSAGILGNGFALRRETLDRVPYRAGSVVEDLEYHIKLVNAGLKVAFADDTEVRGDMPTGALGLGGQRVRWEGGRLRMLREHAPTLLAAVLRGRLRLLEPLADLLLAPLAYHVLLLLATSALAIAAGSTPVLMLALSSLAIVAVHVFAALRVAHLPWTRLLVVFRLPAYLLWKLHLLGATISGSTRDSAWVRTDRTGL